MLERIRQAVKNAMYQFELSDVTINGIWWRFDPKIKTTFYNPYEKVMEAALVLQAFKDYDKFLMKENFKTVNSIGGITLDTETGTMEVEVD